MSKREIIGTRLLKCPNCNKWVQYTPMYFKTRKVKCLVSVCKHNHVRIIQKDVSSAEIDKELAILDGYLILNKKTEYFS